MRHAGPSSKAGSREFRIRMEAETVVYRTDTYDTFFLSLPARSHHCVLGEERLKLDVLNSYELHCCDSSTHRPCDPLHRKTMAA